MSVQNKISHNLSTNSYKDALMNNHSAEKLYQTEEVSNKFIAS